MKKVKNSFGGIIVGILMIIGGTCLLWWNEGNNVRNIEAINEVEKVLKEVGSDKVDSKNDGKLVLVNGNLITEDEEVKDDVFGVSIKTPVMNRIVEIYEWEETEHTDDDNTTYTYEKVWKEELIDSSTFHQSGHTNPTTVEIQGQSFVANNVKLGAFELSSEQKEMLSTKNDVTVSEDIELDEKYKYEKGYVTTSKDLDNPEIGDIRINWKYNNWTKATVLAVQKENTFTKYTAKSGRTINRIFEGELTSSEVLSKIRSEDKMMKWIFRAVGALLIVFGYISVISPLTTLTSFVPFLGGIVGSALTFIAFLIAIIHSLIIIIIAWFRFRPLLAIALLLVVAAIIALIVMLIKKNKAKKETSLEEANA